jgi:3-keto-5-aminohexanoate cleavage enzyme
MASIEKAIVTCAVTGVLTNPQVHPVPVTVDQMAASAGEAFDAGASVLHLHFRMQQAGMGHLPSWEPDVAAAITDAVRERCPGVVINMSTGVIGHEISGPLACLERIKPDMAACNAGTLNYLKTRKDGSWAWPPMIFDNPVEKVSQYLEAMAAHKVRPEFECFDLGIVRSVGLFVDNGMTADPDYNFVVGVASGMPADQDLLPLLLRYIKKGSSWQATVIGRQEVWDVHRRAAELGGALRTGVEDTFYLPSGDKTQGNGQLIEAMVKLAREVGREIASPEEARAALAVS